jgi:hypothetical protein
MTNNNFLFNQSEKSEEEFYSLVVFYTGDEIYPATWVRGSFLTGDEVKEFIVNTYLNDSDKNKNLQIISESFLNRICRVRDLDGKWVEVDLRTCMYGYD